MNIKTLNLNKIIPPKVQALVTLPTLGALALQGLASDKVVLSERANFIKYLNSNYSTEITPIQMQDEDLAEYIVYKNSQEGSNPAFWALNPTNNKLYYIKYAENKYENEHIESEIQASCLYNLAGISTPNIKRCLVNGQYYAMASEYVTNLEEVSKEKDAHIGFAADAWLANWDSLDAGNTRILNGELIKLDNGGALKYRAQGQDKESFGDYVEELVTLIDGTNLASKSIYSGISYNTLINSFNRVCSIKDEDIKAIVQDEKLAQTLIDRRNYMSKVLENIKATPYNGKNLVSYMKGVIQNVHERDFNATSFVEEFSSLYKSKINEEDQTAPSRKETLKILLDSIKKLEKRGIEISREQLIEILETQNNNDLPVIGLRRFQAKAHKEHNKRLFMNLYWIVSKTPQKDGEKISAYLNRTIKLTEKRQKQLDDFRIKNIKSKLVYSPQDKITEFKISSDEKQQIIYHLNKVIESNYESLNKLSQDASMTKILNTWKHMCVGSHDILPKDLLYLVVQSLERYNSSEKPKTKQSITFYDESNAVAYKNEFQYEPTYRWLRFENPQEFIDSLPKNGQTIKSQKLWSCSMHKLYAEEDYNDDNAGMNVKLVIHPKSKISKARVLGYNQEVFYNSDTEFKVLDKELIEYVNPKTGQSIFRWEVHIQEA